MEEGSGHKRAFFVAKSEIIFHNQSLSLELNFLLPFSLSHVHNSLVQSGIMFSFNCIGAGVFNELESTLKSKTILKDTQVVTLTNT